MNAERIVEADALAQERATLSRINRIAELEGLKRQALEAIAGMQGIDGDLDQHISDLRDQVKQWLALEGRTELVDGETGVTVALQERKGTPVYNVLGLVGSEAGAAALLTAASQLGMVKLDHQAITRARQVGGAFLDVIKRYEMPGVGTTALVFRRRGKWGTGAD